MVAYSANSCVYCFWITDFVCPDFTNIIICLYDVLRMRRNILKIVLIVFLIIVSVWLSYRGAYFIGEKYFFDKLFYYKSVSHGYYLMNKNLEYKDFGKRAENLIALERLQSNTVMGVADDGKYNIAIIGDSYVWGQGLRNEQRFAEILEKNLNKTRPTKVMSFANCGDSILDYLARYNNIKSKYKIDLYIFAAVDNDGLLNSDGRLENNDYQNIVVNCKMQNNNVDAVYDQRFEIGKQNQWFENFVKVRTNPTNMCVMGKSIEQLPTERSIYFITDDYFGTDEDFKYYRNFLEKYGKIIVSSDRGKEIKKYQHCWVNDCFNVSKMEGHPSVMANQMYADILYQEIANNQKWNFKSTD